jgi:hypothetical protein
VADSENGAAKRRKKRRETASFSIFAPSAHFRGHSFSLAHAGSRFRMADSENRAAKRRKKRRETISFSIFRLLRIFAAIPFLSLMPEPQYGAEKQSPSPFLRLLRIFAAIPFLSLTPARISVRSILKIEPQKGAKSAEDWSLLSFAPSAHFRGHSLSLAYALPAPGNGHPRPDGYESRESEFALVDVSMTAKNPRQDYSIDMAYNDGPNEAIP